MGAHLNLVQLAQLVHRSVLIADVATVGLVATSGVPEEHGERRWYDVRALLDEREQAPRSADFHREVLDYGLQRGLLQRHPDKAHLVRINHLNNLH